MRSPTQLETERADLIHLRLRRRPWRSVRPGRVIVQSLEPLVLPTGEPLVRGRSGDAERSRGLADRPTQVCDPLHKQEASQWGEFGIAMSYGSLPERVSSPCSTSLLEGTRVNNLFGNYT